MGKEYYEAFGNGRSVRSEDFQTLRAFGAPRGAIRRRDRGNKGQRAELEEFAAAIRGQSYPIEGADARAGLVATWMALAAYSSASQGSAICLTV
jgi:predicted dehydrogenase